MRTHLWGILMVSRTRGVTEWKGGLTVASAYTEGLRGSFPNVQNQSDYTANEQDNSSEMENTREKG